MPRTYAPVVITESVRHRLDEVARGRFTPHLNVQKAQALLWLAEGVPIKTICDRLAISRVSIANWRDRFSESDLSEIFDVQAGRGRKSSLTEGKAAEIVDATLHRKPEDATHWSCRSLAADLGVSHSTVQRIWDAHNIQPHRTKTFKLSTDARFVEKLTDIVGLYMNPPDKAIVLCVDEKSQIQALDRTQPSLPMKPGRLGTMTHDYKRNGTTTLFAALNILEGTVIGQCHARHRHQEFLKFLRVLDREYPKTLNLHLVVDNYGTHKHPKVAQWLSKHTRFVLHFTPTSSSWLNLIERWFRDLTQKRIRRGAFQSVPDLIQAIDDYVRVNNRTPKPFIWSASAQSIMAKISKCKDIYDTVH